MSKLRDICRLIDGYEVLKKHVESMEGISFAYARAAHYAWITAELKETETGTVEHALLLKLKSKLDEWTKHGK